MGSDRLTVNPASLDEESFWMVWDSPVIGLNLADNKIDYRRADDAMILVDAAIGGLFWTIDAGKTDVGGNLKSK